MLQTLLLLTLGALLAYALSPAVKFLEHVMPRLLAILMVYLIVFGALGVLLYLVVRTAIVQFGLLSDYVRFLLTPGKSAQLTPLEQTLRSLGISQSQIASARKENRRVVWEGVQVLTAGSHRPLEAAKYGYRMERLVHNSN